MNGFWDHFMELVAFELQMREFNKEGYKVSFECNDARVNKIGRVIDLGDKSPISYKVKTIKDNKVEEIELKVEF